jgi:hypothetical protein
MVAVIVATDSEIKKAAFETSEIAAHLRGLGVNYKFMNVDAVDCDEFEGPRWPQPFTPSGGMFAAMQRISAVRMHYVDLPIRHYDDLPMRHYDESGMLLGVSKENNNKTKNKNDIVVIAIESYITDNAKDCVCIMVNYYVDGKKRELVAFSPAAYIASFPDKYLQHLALSGGHKAGDKGFRTTVGDLLETEKHLYGGGVSKNWHKLFNPFDRVEQIRGTLNYIADEFKKIVS